MSFKPQSVAALVFLLAGCVTITVVPGGAGAPGLKVRPWPASATCATPQAASVTAARLLLLLNAERQKAGLGPLTRSAAATPVAQAYACEITARRDIGHVGSDGSTLGERLARGGISFSLAAENNAEGYTTPEAVMAGWMASSGHRHNILLGGVTEVGVGVTGGNYPVWVLDFYAPA